MSDVVEQPVSEEVLDNLPDESGDEDSDSSSYTPESNGGESNGGEANSLKSAAKEVIDSIEGASDDSDDEYQPKDKKSAKSKIESIKKSWKLNVGGKDIEISDEKELIKRAQMGYSADEKWQEAAKMRKQIETFVSELQKDPGSALAKMGFDVDSLAEQHIARRIQEMEKSPEQIEREKLQREIEELRTREKKREEDFRSKEMQRMQNEYAMQIENDISNALDASKSLPKSPYVVKRIADTLLLAMQKGLHDVTVQDVLPLVENDLRSELAEMFSVMPEELVEAVVGKDVLNKLRKKRVNTVKAAPAKPKVQATGESDMKALKNKKDQKPAEKVSAKDFFNKLGSF